VKFVLSELKEDLEYSDGRAPSPPVTRRRAVVGAASALGGATLSYIGLRISRDNRPPPIIVTPVAMYPGNAASPALSPDGKMIAFMWDGEHQDNFDIYLKVIGSGEPLRLTLNPRPEVTPLWSPDGRFIAFSRTPGGPAANGLETIFTIPVLGGPERMVGPGFANDWSRDGTVILALFAGRLRDGYRSGMVSGWPLDLLHLERYWSRDDLARTCRWRRAPADHQTRWLCGQSLTRRHLYYLRSSREGELWRAPAEGGEEQLVFAELRNRNFWVLPDGVYLLDTGLSEISPFKRGRARFYRFRTAEIEDLGFETGKPIDHYGISLSPDGKWLYYVQVDRSGSNVMLVENFR